jgi:TPR repeat protein
MSFWPRLGFGRKAREIEALERRVAALQTALKRSESAGRWAQFARGVTAATAVLMLALGFALGVYREPIKQSVLGLARATGLARSTPSADEPYAAYHKGEYATALRLARLLAQDEDDPRAQSLMGLIYYRGQGAPQDYAEAAKWFRLAADHLDIDAQFHLGLMFSQGQGVPQDSVEAARWFRLAADQGDAQAQYNLGVYYATGQAGKPDSVSAYMWFTLAAAHFAASDPRRGTAAGSRDLVAKGMTRDEIAEAQRRATEWKPA